MNTKHLTTFQTILKTGSFKKAAETLNYTQSTVTFQIKQLEEELGIKLFEKIGRKMELTPDGRDRIPLIEELLETSERIKNYGKAIHELSGSLSLAIPDSILIYNMQPFIRRFRKEAPNIELVINSMPSGEINASILSGSSDIGINCEKKSYPENVGVKPLGHYQVHLIGSPFIDPKLTDFITPHQKKPLSLILNEPDGFYQLELNQYLKDKDIVLNPEMKVQSIEAVKRCVMNNLGIAIVPSYSIADELKNKAVTVLKTELDDKVFDSFYVYHQKRWMNPQMKFAIELLEDCLNED